VGKKRRGSLTGGQFDEVCKKDRCPSLDVFKPKCILTVGR
jgi:hypothetical protein